MTEKQIKQVKQQLPEGEHLDRVYSAFEGGLRAISKDRNGNERRYEIRFDADDNAYIKRK